MILATITLLLGIVVLLSIIAANGYFVAQEFAYMSVDPARLSAQAEAGDAEPTVPSRSRSAPPSCSPGRSSGSP